MERTLYQTIILKESHYEKKLLQAEEKAATILEHAKKQSQEHSKEILNQTSQNLEEQKKNFSARHEEQLLQLAKQTALLEKQINRKKEQLPKISKEIAHQLVKEWSTL
jgi:F0F1-type ATP synthase membrane subunit b/b'